MIKKLFSLVTASVSSVLAACSQTAERPALIQTSAAMNSFFELKMKSIDGNLIDFSTYRGKKVLVVNVASECGYTPQYADLQKLQDEYKDKLVVLGFPCNQFGSQEPGSSEEIKTFCSKNYGITFPLFEKADVKGVNKSAVYQWLTDKNLNGWNETEPQWNFNKYLIDENGLLIAYFPSKVKPFDEAIISKLK